MKKKESLFSFNKKGDEVRVTIGKEVRTIKFIDLWTLVFEATKDQSKRDQLMPVRKENIMKFKKVHSVQLKNDMKAGDTLQFSCIIDVPTYVMDGMRDIISKEVPGSKEVLDTLLGLPKPKELSPDDIAINK